MAGEARSAAARAALAAASRARARSAAGSPAPAGFAVTRWRPVATVCRGGRAPARARGRATTLAVAAAFAQGAACGAREPVRPAPSFDTTSAEPTRDAGASPPAVAPAPIASSPEPAGRAGPVGPAPEVASPPSAAEQRLAELRETYAAPRHRPALLGEPARPSRVAPGEYQCAVSREYRLRSCRVEKDDTGRTLLTIDEGNLIAARGVLWDDGAVVRFEGWLTEQRPFGCFACQERCFVEPAGCACVELATEASRRCLGQPMRAELRGAGGAWRGQLHHEHYWNRYEGEGAARHVAGWETTAERYELRLERARR